jgi:vesicle coat complex subunit
MIPLINYLMTATRQVVTQILELQRFELMYTLQGKPDTYDTHVFCASLCTPLVRFLRAVPVCGNLLQVIDSVGHCS